MHSETNTPEPVNEPKEPVQDPANEPAPQAEPKPKRKGNPEWVANSKGLSNVVSFRMTDKQREKFERIRAYRESKLKKTAYTNRDLVIDMMKYLASNPWGDFPTGL